jgi:hypothetical protein
MATFSRRLECEGWESIFSDPMVAKAPSLGVNYVTASLPFCELALPRHDASLELEQQLDALGIAGVVIYGRKQGGGYVRCFYKWRKAFQFNGERVFKGVGRRRGRGAFA